MTHTQSVAALAVKAGGGGYIRKLADPGSRSRMMCEHRPMPTPTLVTTKPSERACIQPQTEGLRAQRQQQAQRQHPLSEPALCPPRVLSTHVCGPASLQPSKHSPFNELCSTPTFPLHKPGSPTHLRHCIQQFGEAGPPRRSVSRTRTPLSHSPSYPAPVERHTPMQTTTDWKYWGWGGRAHCTVQLSSGPSLT